MVNTIEINEIINETDIYVFSKNPETGLFTYSRPLLVEEATSVANAVNASIKDTYANANGLRYGLSVDAKKGDLYNMNTFKGILANQELMRQSNNTLRFSTIQEGLLLYDAKLLHSGEGMDFGLAIYSIGEPNKKLSESLVPQAQAKNYTLPVFASFTALGLQSGGEEYGVTPTFVSDTGLISGADAVKLFNERFSDVEESGVRRLYRDGGPWPAPWYYLDYFGANCRVGLISGEASAKNLQDLAQIKIKVNFSRNRYRIEKQRSGLEQQLQNLSAREKACIKSAESILKR